MFQITLALIYEKGLNLKEVSAYYDANFGIYQFGREGTVKSLQVPRCVHKNRNKKRHNIEIKIGFTVISTWSFICWNCPDMLVS